MHTPHHAGFFPALGLQHIPPALEGLRQQPCLHTLRHVQQHAPEGSSINCKLMPGLESSTCHCALPVVTGGPASALAQSILPEAAAAVACVDKCLERQWRWQDPRINAGNTEQTIG